MSKNTIITVLVTSTTSNYFPKLSRLTISPFKDIYSIVSESDASDCIKMRTELQEPWEETMGD